MTLRAKCKYLSLLADQTLQTVAGAGPSADLVSSDDSVGSADACRRARSKRDRIEGSADRDQGCLQSWR